VLYYVTSCKGWDVDVIFQKSNFIQPLALSVGGESFKIKNCVLRSWRDCVYVIFNEKYDRIDLIPNDKLVNNIMQYNRSERGINYNKVTNCLLK